MTKEKEIIEKFEKNGMVQAMKGAQDFNQCQYDLMLKLFEDIAIPLQKEEFKRMVEGMREQDPKDIILEDDERNNEELLRAMETIREKWLIKEQVLTKILKAIENE